MSGVNAVTSVRDRSYRDLSGLNADFVVGSIKAHCSAHPGANVFGAVEAFMQNRPTRLLP